jgi:hypothetical protein
MKIEMLFKKKIYLDLFLYSLNYVLLLLENTSLATPFIFVGQQRLGKVLEKFLLATPALRNLYGGPAINTHKFSSLVLPRGFPPCPKLTK